MVTKVYLPPSDADADKHIWRNFLNGFFPKVKENARREIRNTVTKAENKIYENVSKPLKKTNPLDYPQMFINGLCKVLDKILDGINAVLRILFF